MTVHFAAESVSSLRRNECPDFQIRAEFSGCRAAIRCRKNALLLAPGELPPPGVSDTFRVRFCSVGRVLFHVLLSQIFHEMYLTFYSKIGGGRCLTSYWYGGPFFLALVVFCLGQSRFSYCKSPIRITSNCPVGVSQATMMWLSLTTSDSSSSLIPDSRKTSPDSNIRTSSRRCKSSEPSTTLSAKGCDRKIAVCPLVSLRATS